LKILGEIDESERQKSGCRATKKVLECHTAIHRASQLEAFCGTDDLSDATAPFPVPMSRTVPGEIETPAETKITAFFGRKQIGNTEKECL